ncbi:MAG TPA: putative toxin-antitoxin system toxin component, PIN family [Xanthobacteraceae bacterium]|jgi:putative PIN family toxin of toxin-antitoxin system
MAEPRCNIASNIINSVMKLVLDTAVMVAAIRSDAGASRRVLVAGLDRQFTMLVSVPLLIEYEAVITRREHLKASRLSVADVGALLDAVAAVAQPVHLQFLWRPILNDPDDEMVLETALNGRADAIVTFNRRDFLPARGRFGIAVLSPADVLDQVEKTS